MDFVALPSSLPLLSLPDPVLPGASVRLSVAQPRAMRMFRQLLQDAQAGLLFVAVSKEPEEAEGCIGTAVMCSQVVSTNWPQPHYQLLISGLCRVRVEEIINLDPFPTAKVAQHSWKAPDDPEFSQLVAQLHSEAGKLLSLVQPLRGPLVVKLRALLQDEELPQKLDALAILLQPSSEEKRAVLHAVQPKERLQTILPMISKRISRLQQQHKALTIARRGQNSGPEELQDEVSELEQRINGCGLPAEAVKVADKELQRLRQMPASLPEFGVIKSYLEFMADLPWRLPEEMQLRVSEAKKILDADHFGLEIPKRRILEFLAVRQLKNSLRGPILCLVGPPGVGKTSIGRSVAKTLGRKFHRLSLGGVCDQSDIRGHRRTYVGAMPGRILQGLKTAGVRNPVLLLDEIDKLTRGVQGDPAAALLEVLDPEQNCTFVDHYLNVPFDLSQVLFIATANSAASIPPALLDRMEFIELSGYTEEEKVRIAEDHLLPKQLEQHGLTAAEVSLPVESVLELISCYTREAGVRTLERRIAALCRAVAIRVAELREGSSDVSSSSPIPSLPFVLDHGALRDILGPARSFAEGVPDEMTPGLSLGLAWTPFGGALMVVEAARVPGPDKVQLTGQLGEVMKESAALASSWVRAHAVQLGFGSAAKSGGLHLHFPAGAIAKDGPSAGVAIVTALVSLFADRPTRPDTAMTGEITLRGLVLPVGGIKAKLLAAARAGLKRVILPVKNEPDLVEVPLSVTSSIKIVFASRIEDVLREAFYSGEDFDTSSIVGKLNKL